MADIFENNTKLFGFDGFIARRDFCLNYVRAWFIFILFSLYSIYLGVYHIYYTKTPIFISDLPALAQFLFFTGAIIFVCIVSQNTVRRLNDIHEKQIPSIAAFFTFIIALGTFSAAFPELVKVELSFIFHLALLFLIFKKGKISSKLPYDVTKEFNLGAFLGTWIWGIGSRTLIPFWFALPYFVILGVSFYCFCAPVRIPFLPLLLLSILPLLLILFCLYCGLMGNEWALKKAGDIDIDEFIRGQRKSAAFWRIIYLILILTPFVYAFYKS